MWNLSNFYELPTMFRDYGRAVEREAIKQQQWREKNEQHIWPANTNHNSKLTVNAISNQPKSNPYRKRNVEEIKCVIEEDDKEEEKDVFCTVGFGARDQKKKSFSAHTSNNVPLEIQSSGSKLHQITRGECISKKTKAIPVKYIYCPEDFEYSDTESEVDESNVGVNTFLLNKENNREDMNADGVDYGQKFINIASGDCAENIHTPGVEEVLRDNSDILSSKEGEQLLKIKAKEQKKKNENKNNIQSHDNKNVNDGKNITEMLANVLSIIGEMNDSEIKDEDKKMINKLHSIVNGNKDNGEGENEKIGDKKSRIGEMSDYQSTDINIYCPNEALSMEYISIQKNSNRMANICHGIPGDGNNRNEFNLKGSLAWYMSNRIMKYCVLAASNKDCNDEILVIDCKGNEFLADYTQLNIFYRPHLHFENDFEFDELQNRIMHPKQRTIFLQARNVYS